MIPAPRRPEPPTSPSPRVVNLGDTPGAWPRTTVTVTADQGRTVVTATTTPTARAGLLDITPAGAP